MITAANVTKHTIKNLVTELSVRSVTTVDRVCSLPTAWYSGVDLSV
jgi:hypothetical protein